MRKIYRGVEEQIQKAMEEGQFDNLPGKGKPIDLSDWQKTPPELRMSFSVLKSAGVSPAEIDIKKSIAEIKAAIQQTTDDEERKYLMERLQSAMADYAIRMDRLRR